VKPRDFPGLPYLSLEHVEAHTTRILGHTDAGSMKSSAVHFQPGDVLYGRLRPYLNKVAAPDFEGLCSAEFLVFPGQGSLSNKYLLYFLNSPGFLSHAAHQVTGDRPRVDFDQLADFQFPMIPLEDQHVVVAEIESKLTRLDAGVTALKRVQANLKRYRAAVLKAACEGRLVPTEAELARREGRPYETAPALLARARAERAVPPANRRGAAREEEAVEPTMGPLPEGWAWARVRDLLGTPPCNGLSIKGADQPPGVPALRLNAMKNGALDFSVVRYLPIDEAAVRDIAIQAGDFFVCRGNGSLDLVGRGALAGHAPGFLIFPDTMIRLRFVKEVEQAGWLPRVWDSELVRRQVEEKVKTTAGIYKISQPEVGSIAVPVPPVAEQRRIVAEIDRRLSVATDVDRAICTSLSRAAACRAAALATAFRGCRKSGHACTSSGKLLESPS